MVKRVLLLLVATCVVLGIAGTSLGQTQARPERYIAFVHDRAAADWATGYRDSLRQEIARVLDVDYQTRMPEDLNRVADGSMDSVNNVLEALLNDNRVDLVVASGPLGSLAASRHPNLTKPVIGNWILDPDLQDVPLVNGTSGKKNFTYITLGNLLSEDLAALQQLVSYKHLTVIGSPGWIGALPTDCNLALVKAEGQEASLVVGQGTVASVLDHLPPTTDAVYLLPMITMSQGQISELLEGFTRRGLPVLSLYGEPEVAAGALVGVGPADWRRRMYRRVALLSSQILGGGNPAEIPVLMLRDGKLFLNMRTARRIDVSPPFEVILDAVMLDDILAPGTEQVDLQAVMNRAQASNYDIAGGEAAVAVGQERVSVAKGNLLPQINIGLGGELIDEDNAEFAPTVSERTFSGNASASQVLYSDRAWAGYTIEKHLLAAREGELEQVRLDVGLQAAQAYLRVLRAQTRLNIQRQNLGFSRTNLERAQIRVSVGDANRSELYRWQSKIAQEKTLVMNALVAQKLAIIDLNRVLARPLEDPLQLVDATLEAQYRSFVNPKLEQYTHDQNRLSALREFLVQKGLSLSPELQQLDASILAVEREHTLATRSFWIPEVGLAGGLEQVFSRGGAGSDMSNPALPDDTSWSVGVYVSLPLLEGGSRFAETRRTTQETFRLRRARESAAQYIEQNVRSSVFQTAASRLAIGLARQAAEAASANLDLVADNYTLGLVGLVELLDAQTNALNADLAAADAVNSFLLDLMRLERAVGQFTFFVPEAERGSWIAELEAFEQTRQ